MGFTFWISGPKSLFSHKDVNNISEHVFASCRVEESTSRWIRRTKESGDCTARPSDPSLSWELVHYF